MDRIQSLLFAKHLLDSEQITLTEYKELVERLINSI